MATPELHEASMMFRKRRMKVLSNKLLISSDSSDFPEPFISLEHRTFFIRSTYICITSSGHLINLRIITLTSRDYGFRDDWYIFLFKHRHLSSMAGKNEWVHIWKFPIKWCPTLPYEIRTRSSGVPSCRGRPRWGQHERSVAEPAASSWEAQHQHDRGYANSKPSSKVAPNCCNAGMIDHVIKFLPTTKHIAKEVSLCKYRLGFRSKIWYQYASHVTG